MALDAGADRAVDDDGAVGLGMDLAIVLFCPAAAGQAVDAVGRLADPVDRLGDTRGVAEAKTLGPQVGVARGLQQGARVDVDQVLLNQEGLGVDVVDRNGAAGKGVGARLDCVLVAVEVVVRAGEQIEVAVCPDDGAAAKDVDLVVRGQVHVGRGNGDRGGAVGLGVDRLDHAAHAVRRQGDLTDALQCGPGADQDPGQGRIGAGLGESADARQGAPGRQRDLVDGVVFVQGPQAKPAGIRRQSDDPEGHAAADGHQGGEIDHRVAGGTGAADGAAGVAAHVGGADRGLVRAVDGGDLDILGLDDHAVLNLGLDIGIDLVVGVRA